MTGEMKRRLAEAAARVQAAAHDPERREDGTRLPTISEEAVRRVRESSFMTKEEREALGIRSRWMVWAIRNGKRRADEEEAPSR